MTDTFFVLECSVEGCRAEFWMNDIPVIRLNEGAGFAGLPINHLLIEGENELEMVLFHGNLPPLSKLGSIPPEGPESVQPTQSASVSLCRYPFGAAVGGPDRVELFRQEWKPTEEMEVSVPFTVKGTCEPDAGVPRWRWQDADPLELDRDTVVDLVEFLETMRASIEEGDPEPFLEKSAIRLEDIAEAFGNEPSEKADLIRRVIPQDVDNEGFGLDPLDPAMFSFRLCGGGSLVEAIGMDWAPLIRGGPDSQGNPIAYDMVLARFDGEWAIVR